ncbi:hypothetical protein [Streptomyces sp. NPDC001502]|uniref:hypothetical protein n=1 Tax=Streptomyces sp. NPDC001502 TaxID=3364578 RepID=UPI00369A0B67
MHSPSPTFTPTRSTRSPAVGTCPLDRHVPLGPDQAARRLGVRRVDFDAAVRLGFLSPVGTVEIDYKRQGGVRVVPLFSAFPVGSAC